MTAKPLAAHAYGIHIAVYESMIDEETTIGRNEPDEQEGEFTTQVSHGATRIAGGTDTTYTAFIDVKDMFSKVASLSNTRIECTRSREKYSGGRPDETSPEVGVCPALIDLVEQGFDTFLLFIHELHEKLLQPAYFLLTLEGEGIKEGPYEVIPDDLSVSTLTNDCCNAIGTHGKGLSH